MRRVAVVGVWVLVGAALLALGVSTALQARFAPTREVVYREVDGTLLKLQLFEPETSDAGRAPAILFFFGGGWTGGFPGQFYPWAERFASLGWVGATADSRVHARDGTNAFAAVDDARAAYRFLVENAVELAIDPQRIVLAGGSAGGHLAAASVITPWPDRAAIPDPAALVLLNPALDTKVEGEDDYLAGVRDLFAGRGEEISPLHHVRAGLPSTLVLHGTDDGIVPFEHSRDFCERMVSLANQCVLRAWEGASHGFFNWGFGRFDEAIEEVVGFVRPLALDPGER